MLQFWEGLELVATFFGAVFILAGVIFIVQASNVKGGNLRIGRTDRLVGGLVLAIFGVAMLLAKALF
jgi:hypothetical protein